MYEDNSKYTQQCCLSGEIIGTEVVGRYKITCKDAMGSGSWNGGYLEINGVKYCEVMRDDSAIFSLDQGTYSGAITITAPHTGIKLKY